MPPPPPLPRDLLNVPISMFEYDGKRADEALVPISPGLSIFCPFANFLQRFFPSNDFLIVFPVHMLMQPMLTLPYYRSRSSQGHDLKLPDATCQVSLKSVHCVRIRRFAKRFFLPYITWIIYKQIVPLYE